MEAMPNFFEEFECDPSASHYGFKSWDDFFVRKYRKGVRPVEAPDDDSVIVNACESAPFKVSFNVEKQDLFWNKKQPYSLGEHNIGDMVNTCSRVKPAFVGLYGNFSVFENIY